MCGIFGLAGPRYCDPTRERQARLLSRRGPDGFGSHEDSRSQVYLAHTRLAVIDLSPRGAQPMCNEDGSVWISFNGEIYGYAALRQELESLGHQFSSATDTEVIVHAYEQWGLDCLARLNGMFAFAIWDSRSGKVVLARDRLGIKPLFWSLVEGTLAFASDARAIVGLPFVRRKLDPSALICYLLYKYVSGEQSIWQGVKRLLPGHVLEFEIAPSRVHTHRYWTLPLQTQTWQLEGALEQFSHLFSDSVRDCLVSDVPVGVFLSGGYDSSAVAKAASTLTHDLHTFSIGFTGWDRDERTTAAHTAERIGSIHRSSVLGVEQFATIDEVIGAYDEPLADSTIFPAYLLCQQVRQQAKVALSGDGGDEILAGYSWYGQTVHARRRKQAAFAFDPIVQALGIGKSALGQRCSPLAHYRMLTSPTFTIPEITRLFPSLPAESLPADETYLYRQHLRPDLDGMLRWQFIDLNTFLVDTNLATVDRASMAHGLEVRVPFLDHRLVEFAFSLPEQLLSTSKQRKVLLARWLQDHGLSELVAQPKQGFSSPWQQFWPTAAIAAELPEGWLVQNGWLDRGELKRLIDNENSPPHRDLKLFVLAILERWAKQFVA